MAENEGNKNNLTSVVRNFLKLTKIQFIYFKKRKFEDRYGRGRGGKRGTGRGTGERGWGIHATRLGGEEMNSPLGLAT